jgi:hypothetical protein
MKRVLFDGSRPSMAFNDFHVNILNTVRSMLENLGDKVVGIKDEGLEQPRWREGGGDLMLICVNTHDRL